MKTIVHQCQRCCSAIATSISVVCIQYVAGQIEHRPSQKSTHKKNKNIENVANVYNNINIFHIIIIIYVQFCDIIHWSYTYDMQNPLYSTITFGIRRKERERERSQNERRKKMRFILAPQAVISRASSSGRFNFLHVGAYIISVCVCMFVMSSTTTTHSSSFISIFILFLSPLSPFVDSLQCFRTVVRYSCKSHVVWMGNGNLTLGSDIQ